MIGLCLLSSFADYLCEVDLEFFLGILRSNIKPDIERLIFLYQAYAVETFN